MRIFARIWGAVADASGTGIVSSTGNPILPSGTLAGSQPAIGTPTAVWVVVETAANGDNSMVYLVCLCQVLQLNLGEDPLWSNVGIPAIEAVQQGVAPDYYVSQVQSQFAAYFASLTIQRSTDNSGDPVYNVAVMTFQGAVWNAAVPIPT